MDGAILDVGLVGQVVRGLDGDFHPLDGQEGGQVGRVGGDDDEGEEPPHSADDAAGQRSESRRRSRRRDTRASQATVNTLLFSTLPAQKFEDLNLMGTAILSACP